MDAADRAEAQFGRLVESMIGMPDVTVGTGSRRFGAGALMVDDRIFAMLTRGALVLKLPAGRVASLISSGEGRFFDAGKGRPMKEWVTIDHGSDERWLVLAQEARAFVGGRG